MSVQIWQCNFNPPVALSDPFTAPPFNDQWWQNVLNTEPLPGAQFGDGSFQLQIGKALYPTKEDANTVILNDILSSWPGSDGYVLRQQVLSENLADPFGQARSNWVFDPDLETYGVDWTTLIRVWLPPDLFTTLNPKPAFTFNFHQIWECKSGPDPGVPTMGCDFGVIWENTPTERLIWNTTVRTFDEFGIPEDTLYAQIAEDVILNEFFDLEIYIRFSQTDGRLVTKINGLVLGDYSGPTIEQSVASTALRWKLVSLYTALDRGGGPGGDGFPHLQIVDSIKLFQGQGLPEPPPVVPVDLRQTAHYIVLDGEVW